MKSMTEISKTIAYVLRHKPEHLGLEMDAHGWVSVENLIEKINTIQPFDMAQLEEIVRTDNKQRYAFNADKTMIRANQGHSIPVDLELESVCPPDILWHGTGEKYVESIDRQGLLPKSRQHVHLSADADTALAVGKRHGKPVLYWVAARQMAEDGYVFYRSENGVWLTNAVPCKYLCESAHDLSQPVPNAAENAKNS